MEFIYSNLSQTMAAIRNWWIDHHKPNKAYSMFNLFWFYL